MAEVDANTYDNPEKVLPADTAAGIVYDDYLRSKREVVDRVRPRMNTLYKTYRAHTEKKDELIQSNLTIPLAFTQVEAFVSRVGINKPRVEVWPRGGAEDVPRATAHRVKLDYDWDHMDMPWKLVNFVKSAFIYGTSWMKVRYRKETAVRLVKKEELVPNTMSVFGVEIPMPGPGRMERTEVEELVTVWDDPDTECIELDEIYPDPDMKSLDDPDGWVIHRRKRSLRELEQLQNSDGSPRYNPSIVSKLKKMGDTNQRKTDDGDSLRETRDSLSGLGGDLTQSPHKREFTILEKWSDQKVVSIVEEHLDLDPIENRRNPYGLKPFVIYTPIPDPNALLGIPPVEVVYSLQKELTGLHNARMDHVMQTVHAMMTVRRGSNLNPKNIRVRPRGWAMVEEHDDINWLRPPALEFSLYREDDQLQIWGQKAGGATDSFVGVGAQGGGTATEAALQNQSSGSRAGHMLNILVMQSLNRLGRILIRMNEVEMTAARNLPAIDSATQVLVSPEVLTGGSNIDLDVKIDVAETEPETRLFRRKEKLEALQVLGQIFQDPNHPVMKRLVTDLLETYDIREGESLAQEPVIPQQAGGTPAGVGGGGGGMAGELAAAFGQSAPNAGGGSLV